MLLFIALFLFGVIAALFGPIKYGILPDHLQRSELPAGNALVEGATFIAILLGTIVGGLAAREGSDPVFFAFLIIVFSLSCWISSLFIPPTGEAAPNLVVRTNIVVSTVDLLKQLREDRAHLVGRDRHLLVLGRRRASRSSCCRRWSRTCSAAPKRWRRSASPFSRSRSRSAPAWRRGSPPDASSCCRRCSAPSCSASSRSISASPPGASCLRQQGQGIAEVFGSVRGVRIGIDLAGLAIAGGLFIVPVFAAVQAWAGVDRRARVIAGVNVLNAAAMALEHACVDRAAADAVHRRHRRPRCSC